MKNTLLLVVALWATSFFAQTIPAEQFAYDCDLITNGVLQPPPPRELFDCSPTIHWLVTAPNHSRETFSKELTYIAASAQNSTNQIDRENRMRCITFLMHYGTTNAVDMLRSVATNGQDECRIEALSSLAWICEGNPCDMEVVQTMMRSDDEVIATSSAKAIYSLIPYAVELLDFPPQTKANYVAFLENQTGFEVKYAWDLDRHLLRLDPSWKTNENRIAMARRVLSVYTNALSVTYFTNVTNEWESAESGEP